MIDMGQIPTDPDGKPNREAMMAAMQSTIDDYKAHAETLDREYSPLVSERNALRGKVDALTWAIVQLSTKEARAFSRLDARRKIRRQVFLTHLAYVGVATVAIPLCAALVSFAWRFGLWSILQ